MLLAIYSDTYMYSLLIIIVNHKYMNKLQYKKWHAIIIIDNMPFMANKLGFNNNNKNIKRG